MKPSVPSVPAYAEENRCPHCKGNSSIDLMIPWNGHWADDNVRPIDPGDDELCHCNMCGKSFIQHYDRVFCGQTASGSWKPEPMPPTREEQLEKAAGDLAQYVGQLLERIEEKEEACQTDPDTVDIAQAFTGLIESHTYKQAKKYLEQLNVALKA